jgi:hypothetical protein
MTKTFDAGNVSRTLSIGVGGPGMLTPELPKFPMFRVRAMIRMGMMAACSRVGSQFLRIKKTRFFFTIVLVCLARPKTTDAAIMQKGEEVTESNGVLFLLLLPMGSRRCP